MDAKIRKACERYALRTVNLEGGYGRCTAWALVATSVHVTGRYGAMQRRLAFEELGYPKKQPRKVAA